MSHREKQLKKSAVRVVESDLGVIDLPYLLLTLLLVAIGLLVLFSASYARAYYETKNAASVFVNQLIFAVMGIGVMWLISRVPYEWYQKLSLLILAASIGLLVLVPVIGTESGGATARLRLRELPAVRDCKIRRHLLVCGHYGGAHAGYEDDPLRRGALCRDPRHHRRAALPRTAHVCDAHHSGTRLYPHDARR